MSKRARTRPRKDKNARMSIHAHACPSIYPPPPPQREILTEVVLTSTPDLETKSALFVAWGQLLAIDLALTSDNASEPFDIPCNAATVDGDGIDVWCPLGEASDDISFSRSVLSFLGGGHEFACISF